MCSLHACSSTCPWQGRRSRGQDTVFLPDYLCACPIIDQVSLCTVEAVFVSIMRSFMGIYRQIGLWCSHCVKVPCYIVSLLFFHVMFRIIYILRLEWEYLYPIILCVTRFQVCIVWELSNYTYQNHQKLSSTVFALTHALQCSVPRAPFVRIMDLGLFCIKFAFSSKDDLQGALRPCHWLSLSRWMPRITHTRMLWFIFVNPVLKR